MPSIASIVSWVLIGLVGGSLAGLITTWDRKGLGWARNLGVGLAGAIVGCVLLTGCRTVAELDKITISLRDIVAACIGSLLVLIVLWIWGRSKSTSKRVRLDPHRTPSCFPKQKDRLAAVLRKFHHALIKRPRAELGVLLVLVEAGCLLVRCLAPIESVVHADQDSGRGRFGVEATAGVTANKTEV